MTSFKWLNYKTYEFNNRHKKDMITEDSKICGITCLAFSLILFVLWLLTLVDPFIHYNIGMSNTNALFYGFLAGVFIFVLSKLHIKNEKIYILERRSVRGCFSFLFLMIFITGFIYSDYKMEAMFIYFAYCAVAVTLLHINPLGYAVQTVALLSILTSYMYAYFESVSAVFMFMIFMSVTIFLSFRSYFVVNSKLIMLDQSIDHKFELECALRDKTEEILNSARRQTAIQENVILAIADLVENRDTDTGTHIKATSYYAKLIAENARKFDMYSSELTDEFIYLIDKAAPMHDLGKIMIPDAILKAPRRLTTEEFEIMKQHTIEGARIIRHVYANIETLEYITCASNIAYYHHERWDGTGYPEKLSGENIPYLARITAIADSFDAMTSRRTYRDSMPMDIDGMKMSSSIPLST